MSDKSSVFRCVLCVVAFCAACTGGQPSPEEQVKDFLGQALVSLYIRNDLDAYLQEVDFDGELDSVQSAAVEAMHRQFADYLSQTHGGVTSVDVTGAEFESDSVCYVYYHLSFADSTELPSMHKVVYTDGRWRIKGRN